MKNFEQIVLLLISGQGILLSLALLSTILKRRWSTFFLGLIILVFTLEILNAWATGIGYHSTPHMLPFWILGSYLILPSALFFFVKANTKASFLFRGKDILYFVPACIEIGLAGFVFYSNRLLGTDYHLIENQFWFFLTEILPLIGMVAVLAYFGFVLLQLTAQYKNYRSKMGLQSLTKLYIFFAVFLFLTLLWALQSFFQIEVFNIIKTLLLLFIFAMGYLGYFQPRFFDVPEIIKFQKRKNNYPNLDDSTELERLRHLFEKEKVFLKQKLTLAQVAEQLNLPERYLSELINTHHKTSFRHFVNQFRVNEAIERIQNPQQRHKSLLGIAMDVGFNSKSTFNQSFKVQTGKNPSDYLNNK
ncbi:MAG: helix-turn-helix domain-containing protein [Allomuricauda sp.]|uniref:AraC family transcriptional regulator n=1 Tax=Flagellimonas profundi TaxID=2915620 RepID=A0ABS3FF01_9FLAO|nr:helix-turn-helix domain-containing protein [Allomuricauda profundi]MBO0341156.1 AraC family transcriptional regulator [Allomuricauda profundi]